MKKQVESLLVVGVDTVAVAKSATEAGYKVYAADYFGDLDLRRISTEWESTVEQRKGKSCRKMETLNPEGFVDMADSLQQRYQIEGTLVSSGLDDFPDILFELDDIAPILGNTPRVTEEVRKKPEIFNHLEDLGIPYPKTVFVKSLDQAYAAASEIGYPVVVKPAKGFAGAGIRKVERPGQMEQAFLAASSVNSDLLIQEFIDGTPASVSFIASNGDIEILTVNEQLLGAPFLFPSEPFGYCGNVVPLYFSGSILKDCRDIAEKIYSKFNLKGSNGIDLVVSKQGVPYVMEVNPRFQGTLECIERVLGINVVQAHIDAVLHGVLPHLKDKPSTFCIRLVLHAPQRTTAPDLTVFPEARDIPLPGTIIEKGEPLCSIITEGNSRKNSLQKGKDLARSVYNRLSTEIVPNKDPSPKGR